MIVMYKSLAHYPTSPLTVPELLISCLFDDSQFHKFISAVQIVNRHSLKVLGKSVGLCKTTKRKDQLYIVYLFLYGESSVKISTQTDSY